jgi:hypothetical protein
MKSQVRNEKELRSGCRCASCQQLCLTDIRNKNVLSEAGKVGGSVFVDNSGDPEFINMA